MTSKARYNPPGYWRPLAGTGDLSDLNALARTNRTNDRVLGCLQYIRVTDCVGIEFVVKTQARLDFAPVTLPFDVTLFPCFVPTSGLATTDDMFQLSLEQEQAGFFIYDGWKPLQDAELDTVERGLEEIRSGLALLSLYVDTSVNWAIKYKFVDRSEGYARPTQATLAALTQASQAGLDPQSKIGQAIQRAIDWFMRGRNSNNDLNRFLCYCVAVEGLGLNFWEKYAHESVEDRRNTIRSCIEAKMREFDEGIDAEMWGKDVYFECVQSIRRRLSWAFSALYGDSSAVEAEFFNSKPSIYKLRSNIAHGRISSSDSRTEVIVRDRIPNVRSLARFLIVDTISYVTGQRLELPDEMLMNMSLDMRQGIYSDASMIHGDFRMRLRDASDL